MNIVDCKWSDRPVDIVADLMALKEWAARQVYEPRRLHVPRHWCDQAAAYGLTVDRWLAWDWQLDWIEAWASNGFREGED